MSALRRRCTALGPLVLCGVLTACHVWQLEPLTPGRPAQWKEPVRVVLANGEGYEFVAARVTRDTLYGTPRCGASDSTVAIAIGRVARVERREFSESRTFGVAVGSVLLTAAFALGALVVGMASAWNGS